ncbi:hypothetical protein ACI2L1_22970 [Streptomyces sp. NPDC019531]|uniref:hypothetical protein n=1 Tax=Streptomyces sp. NPDC019531 TaxID=3365062 RepID=UPI00384B4AEF
MGEERLIEQPAHEMVGSQVRGVAVAGEVECAGEVGLDLVELSCRCAQPLFNGSKLTSDAVLLAGDEIQRHRPAVNRLDQLPSLLGELGLLRRQVFVLLLGFVAIGDQLSTQRLLNRVA